MKTAMEKIAELTGPIATMAAMLRREGRSEPDVEEAIAAFLKLDDSTGRQELRRLLLRTRFAFELGPIDVGDGHAGLAPTLKLAAATSSSEKDDAVPRRALHIQLQTQDGQLFALTTNDSDRVCIELVGRQSPASISVLLKGGCVIETMAEDRGEFALLDFELDLIELVEGAEDGVLPALFSQ